MLFLGSSWQISLCTESNFHMHAEKIPGRKKCPCCHSTRYINAERFSLVFREHSMRPQPPAFPAHARSSLKKLILSSAVPTPRCRREETCQSQSAQSTPSSTMALDPLPLHAETYIFETKRSLLVGLPFFPLASRGVSVHISLTFSSTMFMCRSKALTRASSLRFDRMLMST